MIKTEGDLGALAHPRWSTLQQWATLSDKILSKRTLF